MIDLVLEVVTLTYSYFIHIRRRIDRPDFVHATVRQGYSKDIKYFVVCNTVGWCVPYHPIPLFFKGTQNINAKEIQGRIFDT